MFCFFFKRGKLCVQDDQRFGRTTSVSIGENIDEVHDLILSKPRIGLKSISEILSIIYERTSYFSCRYENETNVCKCMDESIQLWNKKAINKMEAQGQRNFALENLLEKL